MRHFVAALIIQSFVRINTMLGNIKLLVQLRWVAISFQMLALAATIVLHLPVNIGFFLFGLGIQIVVNIIAYARLEKKSSFLEGSIFAQLIADLLSLNIFMVASGGLANPFSGLFLIQAVLASILLSGIRLWIMISATALSYTALLLGFNPSCQNHHLWMEFHIQGMIINHVITTVVIGYFVFRIVNNLKHKEQQLYSRQSLVGAGATAAQIAHKIGTPLNIMAVIAEDLSEKSLSSDKIVLLREIDRCKDYLSRFFKSLHRLENTGEDKFLSGHFSSFIFKTTHFSDFSVSFNVVNDRPVYATNAELIVLILDIMTENAYEAKATKMHIEAQFSKKNLILDISNDGPPLPDEIQSLMTIGYSQKKGLHHAGVGLFLVRLVIDSLGAALQVVDSQNVHIKITIPIETIQTL